MPNDLFTLLPPTTTPTPIIANLPHSGLKVPTDVAKTFTPEHLSSLPNSDWHLQPLYRFLPELGVTVLQANYSRYVVDLNRSLKPPFFGSFWSSVVPEQTAFKKPIYLEKPSSEDVRSRIETYYTPYHQQLTNLLNQTISRFGQVYLFDLHSFMGLITEDICLGNADGKTCSEPLLQQVNNSFTEQAYQVVNNKVFSGGYITRHYGQQPDVEALQIELRYTNYLAQDQLERTQIPTYQGPQFDLAQKKLKAAFHSILASIS
ncbi:MAG: N-formylglutamate amidohydrolase [Leptolyngbya foveolarum]|uniref:N-formylglutamate amidohydrolase n=1 Tax=Leptolyngbya foveolarum TaxID=47253 RepID=A0A2W4TVD8_9CYAN|nr:MAG: N-formylglutamate amidohydrolase [Leptolyngbya foveolarum]